MLDQIKRWSAPPVFPDDEAKTRRAESLNNCLLNIATLVPVLLLGNWLGGRTPLPVFVAIALAVVMCFVLRAWMFRGAVRAASVGIIAMGLVLVTVSVASLGTIRAPATALYLLIVIEGGLLFNLPGMLIATALCSLLIGGLISTENAGLLPQPDYSVTITQWISLTAFFAWTGSLPLAALQTMHQALERAQSENAERKEMEEALRESKERFRVALENTPIVVFNQDLELRYTWIYNPHLGFTPETVLGKTDAELLPTEDAAELTQIKRRVTETGVAAREQVRTTISGEVFFYDLIVEPLRDATGNTVGVTCASVDVTAHKRAEEELVRVFDLVPDLICVASADGYFKKLNSAWEKTLGFTTNELMSSPFADFIHPDDLAPTLAEVKKQIEGQPTINFVNRYLCKNGVYKWLEWVSIPSPDRVLLYAAARDITERKRAEEMLRESEEKFSAAFNNNSVPLALATMDGRWIDVNKAFCSLLGYSREELIGKTSAELGIVDPKIRQEILTKARATGSFKEIEVKVRDRHGNILTVLSSAETILLNGVPYRITTNVDITDRKRLEEALRESEAELAEAQRVAELGSWSFDILKDKVRWSDELYRIFDVEKTEFTGLYDSFLSQVHPEDRPRVLQVNAEAKAVGSPFELEYRIVTRTGTKIIREIAYATKDVAGKVVRLFGTAQDITERKRAEEALRASNIQLATLIQNSPLAIVAIDSHASVETWNPAAERLFGWTAEEAIGRPIRIVQDEDRRNFEELIAAEFNGETRKGLDMRRTHKDGTFVDVSLWTAPLYDAQGRIKGTIGIFADTRERRLAEQERERLHNQMQRLSRQMVEVQETERRKLARELHDRVGQNLSALGINLNIVRSQLPPTSPEQAHARLEDSFVLVQETMDRVRDVMSDLRPAILDDYGLLSALRWYGDRFAQRTGIATTIHGDESAPRLASVVETAFYRIAQEALTNIAKHAHATQATLTVEETGGHTRLTITDDGKGFDPQAQTQSSWGLATMRERAQAVGARLAIETAPGKGTRIIVEV